MKKLLFTAMAVMAFSGVSFAKTGEVVSGSIAELCITENQVLSPLPVSPKPSLYCHLLGVSVMLEALALDINETKASEIGHATISACTSSGW